MKGRKAYASARHFINDYVGKYVSCYNVISLYNYIRYITLDKICYYKYIIYNDIVTNIHSPICFMSEQRCVTCLEMWKFLYLEKS